MMDEGLKEDFSIDWEEDQYVSRREFLKFMTLASGGLAVGSAAMAVWANVPREKLSFEPMRIASLSKLGKNEALPFNYPRKSDICLLVRKPDGSIVAFSRRCTHLSCPVEFEPDRNRLYCPCHNGAFSLEDGRVLQGPPPEPLPQIMLDIRGDEIWAIGVKRGEA